MTKMPVQRRAAAAVAGLTCSPESVAEHSAKPGRSALAPDNCIRCLLLILVYIVFYELLVKPLQLCVHLTVVRAHHST